MLNGSIVLGEFPPILGTGGPAAFELPLIDHWLLSEDRV